MKSYIYPKIIIKTNISNGKATILMRFRIAKQWYGRGIQVDCNGSREDKVSLENVVGTLYFAMLNSIEKLRGL